MIIGNIKNKNFEGEFSSSIKKALDYIKNTNFSSMKGKYDVEGDKLFAIIDEYETIKKEDKQTEAHRKYIDLQFIYSGSEMMGCAFENSENEVLKEYDEEKDVVHFSKVKEEVNLPAYPGMFFIFFPEEIHRPGCILEKKEFVKKVIVKIPIDLI
tara:strand:+ start:953 stop:1417 length:465 start_codon:yes stop_codon:yes gene_type:complete